MFKTDKVEKMDYLHLIEEVTGLIFTTEFELLQATQSFGFMQEQQLDTIDITAQLPTKPNGLLY